MLNGHYLINTLSYAANDIIQKLKKAKRPAIKGALYRFYAAYFTFLLFVDHAL